MSMSIHTDDDDSHRCAHKTDHDHQPNVDLIQIKHLCQQMKRHVMIDEEKKQ